MTLTPNEKKLNETHSQLNDRKSWLFTHMADTLLNRPITWYGFNGKTQPKGSRNTVTLAQMVGWFDSGLASIAAGIRQANTTLAGLQAAVEALGKRQGIDPEEMARVIGAAVKVAADKHLGEIGTYQLTRVDIPSPEIEEKK